MAWEVHGPQMVKNEPMVNYQKEKEKKKKRSGLRCYLVQTRARFGLVTKKITSPIKVDIFVLDLYVDQTKVNCNAHIIIECIIIINFDQKV